MWKKLFSNIILERGFDYFQDDKIVNIKIEDEQIFASVLGSEEYDVYIKTNYTEIVNMDCSCPFFRKGYTCKHIAAVLYYLEYENYFDLNAKISPLETATMLKEMSHNELTFFLYHQLRENNELFVRFLNYNNEFKLNIAEILGEGFDNILLGLIDEFDEEDYKLLFIYLKEKFELLLFFDFKKQAFEFNNYVLDSLILNGDDDFSDEILFAILINYLVIIKECDHAYKRKILYVLKDQLNNISLRNHREIIIDFIFKSFEESEFLADKLSLIY